MIQGLLEKVVGIFGVGLGKYKFLRLLSTGSMSRVWSAVDSSSRTFAIKICQKNMQKLADRLTVKYRDGKTEGEVTRELFHPNIVRAFDCGKSSRGGFLVMELMNGALMKQRLKVIRQRAREGDLSLFIRISHALQYIHEKGYVHRDFNPRNIFILEDGRPKVFDFGLTIMTRRALERPGNRTGTAAYMAPEIIRRLPNDHRADIYAFGVMMFETVTGTRPILGDTSIEKIMQMINSNTPQARERFPEIDPTLNDVIAKAMAKDTSYRFAMARELMEALMHIDKSKVDWQREFAEFDQWRHAALATAGAKG